MYLNRAIIIGNLTRDPELKTLPSGISITSFGVATNRIWKDKNNQKQESTDFHNIVVFGRQAETAAQYLRKGASVLVEGRIQTRSWDAPDGAKKYRTEIVADRIQFGPKRDGGNTAATPMSAKGEVGVPTSDENVGIEYPEDNVNVDDIPF